MRQCELEKVIREKGNTKLKRTGEKLTAFLSGVSIGMDGSIIELKKNTGLWVIDKIYDHEVKTFQLKRNWSVSDSI